MLRSLRYGDNVYQFGPVDPNGAVDLWIAWAIDRLAVIYAEQPFAVVPVPNSSAVFGSNPTFRTAELARRMAAADPARISVVPQLSWREVMQPASKGGPSRLRKNQRA
jgi:hypothetical protein